MYKENQTYTQETMTQIHILIYSAKTNHLLERYKIIKSKG